MPSYLFSDFKRCCIENPKGVQVLIDPENDAKNFFGLKTKTELKDFIGNDGLEELTFINTREWENNPDKSITIFVDAYEFRSMYKLGYIAFMHSKKTGNWIIKSFKPSENRNKTMAIALYKAGLIEEV